MSSRLSRIAWIALTMLLGTELEANATLIAEWSFDDGSFNDSVGGYPLSAVGGGPAISGGIAHFGGDDASPAYLETTGFGGHPTWTLGLRLRATGPFDQGAFQGILSNNSSASAANSWQVENFGGLYQLRTTNGTFAIGAPTGGFDTIAVRKLNGGDGDIWFNGVQVVSSLGVNPGGLQNFRLGTNRNSNRLYEFDLDFARVYTTVGLPGDAVALVPEPSVSLLVGLGLFGLGVMRRTN